MENYKITQPLRMTDYGTDMYLLSAPRQHLRVEINGNTYDFITYLSQKNQFSIDDVNEYVNNNNIKNKQEYIDLFHQMIDVNIIVLA